VLCIDGAVEVNCQHCGREVGFSSIATGDWDFCSSRHRIDFHNRLRKGMALLGDAPPQELTTAGPLPLMRPCDGSILPSFRFEPAPYACGHPMRSPGVALTISLDALPNETANAESAAVIAGNEPVPVAGARLEMVARGKAPKLNNRARGRSGAAVVPAKPDRAAELLSRLDRLRRNLENAAGSERQFCVAVAAVRG
jgi:hypothetical protein